MTQGEPRPRQRQQEPARTPGGEGVQAALEEVNDLLRPKWRLKGPRVRNNAREGGQGPDHRGPGESC